MGSLAVGDFAQASFQRLQHVKAKNFAGGQIEHDNSCELEAISELHEVRNDGIPFLKLPVEILLRILEFVPDLCTDRYKDYTFFWRTTIRDSSMLIPVSGTCRRLREVALAYPRLWNTVQISRKDDPLVGLLAERSQHFPLNVVSSDLSAVEGLPRTARVRSMHFDDIACDEFRHLCSVVEEYASPALESFSLSASEMYEWNLDEDPLPLTPIQAPNLRRLALDTIRALPACGFPNLTHLALIDVWLSHVHDGIILFMSQCPRLESVVLDGFVLETAEEGIPDKPSPLPLAHLRHVILHQFSPTALKYYTTLLQPRVSGSSVQVLGSYQADDISIAILFPSRGPQPNDSESIIRLCVGVHPDGEGEYNSGSHSVSITTVTPTSTRRIAAYDISLETNGIPSNAWPHDILSNTSRSRLEDVQEVWLYGVGSGSSYPWTDPSHALSPLQHCSNAKIMVVVVDLSFHYDDEPSLCLLPSTRETASGSGAEIRGVTTLRLVHGCSHHDTFCQPPERHRRRAGSHKVPLGRLIEDVGSGEYSYLEQFVLQVTPHMHVDPEELERLRACFQGFTFERVEEFPAMPGHTDPARWGCERWPGSLW